MKFQDYYTTLGVSRAATGDEIKRAYRRLAKEWHPDRHPPNERSAVEAKFKAIAEANEVLSDPEKRKRYDALGEHWRHGQDFQAPPGGGRRVRPEDFAQMFGGGGGGFSDFFAQMFGDMFAGGSRASAQRAARGADAEAELAVGVATALRGGKLAVAIQTALPCEACEGEGHLGMRACPRCGGLGSTQQPRELSLTVPKLSRDGQVLRLRGLGGAGQGGNGDLLVRLRLVDEEHFRRKGEDLEADIVLAPWELLDGVTVQVAVADGTASARVPAGSKLGSRLRLRGQGLQKADGTRGDLLLALRLGLPEVLSERQQALLRELGQQSAPVHGGARQ